MGKKLEISKRLSVTITPRSYQMLVHLKEDKGIHSLSGAIGQAITFFYEKSYIDKRTREKFDKKIKQRQAAEMTPEQMCESIYGAKLGKLEGVPSCYVPHFADDGTQSGNHIYALSTFSEYYAEHHMVWGGGVYESITSDGESW